jgi:hypothetical protein
MKDKFWTSCLARCRCGLEIVGYDLKTVIAEYFHIRKNCWEGSKNYLDLSKEERHWKISQASLTIELNIVSGTLRSPLSVEVRH